LGCFRDVFFFSFLGRIVSELGFVLRVPMAPSFKATGANECCGIEVTVSVSTVMCCTDPSEGLVFLFDMLDCRDGRAGGTLVNAGLLFPLTLPLSLPLSLLEAAKLALAVLRAENSRWSACEPASDAVTSSTFSKAPSSS
jgi:hypothetical protein